MKRSATLILASVLIAATFVMIGCSRTQQLASGNVSRTSQAAVSQSAGATHVKYGKEAADYVQQYKDGKASASETSNNLNTCYELMKTETSSGVDDTSIESYTVSLKSYIDLDKLDGKTFKTSPYTDKINSALNGLKSSLQ